MTKPDAYKQRLLEPNEAMAIIALLTEGSNPWAPFSWRLV